MVKVYMRSAAEYKMATNFERSGKREQALEHYNLALRWYLPFNPYARQSLGAMWEMGVD